jgi:hypothetical protein
MKERQTENHKKITATTSIGSKNRTVGLTSKPREKKKRSINANKSTPIKRTGNRSQPKTKGCSGCSRYSRNN